MQALLLALTMGMVNLLPGAAADSDFLALLRGDLTGIHYSEAARFSNAAVEREFWRVIAEPDLAADPRVIANLMFLVRKRELGRLLPGIERLLSGRALAPLAEVSTLKTLYALGGARERGLVDARLSKNLRVGSPFFDAAERIGGLATLERLRQLQAQPALPDALRGPIQDKRATLARKLEIAALAEPERARRMAGLFLRREGQLGYWAGHELIAHPSPAAVQGVGEFLTQDVDALVPAAGIAPEQRAALLRDYRLRGTCLLRSMHAVLRPAEKQLLQENAARIRSDEPFYCPRYDWEDVLDQN